MKKIRVHLGDRSYDVLIGQGLIASSGKSIKRLRIGKDAVVITNRRLLALYKRTLEKSLRKSGMTVRFELIPDSEKAKSSAVFTGLVKRISAYDKNKELFLVALGGGVVGDLTGFVAAVYKRGIPYVQIPTTLLAQVDSSIGGKAGIDLPVAKNLVGAFYQPRIVIADIGTLASLPARQLASGLSEVIKYGIIKDRELFAFIEKKRGNILRRDRRALEFVVYRSALIKAGVVEADEFDRRGVRAILNYGHTIGHAIEAALKYAPRCSHGEAVAIGMAASAEIAFWLGMVDMKEINRIKALIKAAGLPISINGLSLAKVYEAHLHDKKFIHGQNRFVLPRRIGDCRVVEGIPDFIIVAVLKKALEVSNDTRVTPF